MKPRYKVFSIRHFCSTKKELAKLNPSVEISINLKYPEIKLLTEYKIKKRPKVARNILSQKCNETRQLIETLGGRILDEKSRPFEIKAAVKYLDLKIIQKQNQIEIIWLTKIDGIRKKKINTNRQFYVVVSKVRIRIEGIPKKKNDLELRISMIKAKSGKKAIKKTTADYKEYAKPYLNTDGRIVIWELVKVLDVYETGVYKSTEFNKNSVELYSKFIRSEKLLKSLEK